MTESDYKVQQNGKIEDVYQSVVGTVSLSLEFNVVLIISEGWPSFVLRIRMSMARV